MNAREFTDRLLAAARAAGIDPAQVSVSESASFSAGVREGRLEQYDVGDSLSVSLRGRFGGRIGSASTQALDEESVSLLIEGVKESAALIETDEQDPILPPEGEYGAVEGYSEALDGVSAEEKLALAMEIDRRLREEDARLRPDMSVVRYDRSAFSLRNTLGLDLTHRANEIYAYASALAKEGESGATGFKLVWGHSLADVSAEAAAKGCARDALEKLHAGRMKSGEYAVVIRRDAMADLLATFSGVFSADNAQQGLSLLAGREGTRIAADCVTVVDDPMMPWGPGSSPFDREGAATRKKNVVERGVLTTLLHNRKTAKKAGVRTTGNAAGGGRVAPSNLYIAPGERAPEALIADAGDGLYVTEVMGLHAGANAVSGDFSLLSRGFVIENGKLGRPVEQFTVAGNFFRLLEDIAEVADDLKFEGSPIASPTVRVKKLSVAGE